MTRTGGKDVAGALKRIDELLEEVNKIGREVVENHSEERLHLADEQISAIVEELETLFDLLGLLEHPKLKEMLDELKARRPKKE